MNINKEKLIKLTKKLDLYDDIFIYRHSNPDGDALGSQFGLARILRSRFPEKNIKVIGTEKTNKKLFDFFPEFNDVTEEELSRKFLAIVLDTANSERINHMSYQKADYVIKIDHHPNTDNFSDLSLVYPEAASTTELLMTIFEDELDFSFSKKTYKYMLIGMITDTNRFNYSSTTKNTLNQAAKTYEHVDFNQIYKNLYKRKFKDYKESHSVFKLAKITNNVSIVIIPKYFSRLKGYKNGAKKSYLDDLFEPYELEYILYSSYDFEKKMWKGSLRSKNLPINKLASKYNGGGHPMASGFILENKKQVKKLAEELIILSKGNINEK